MIGGKTSLATLKEILDPSNTKDAVDVMSVSLEQFMEYIKEFKNAFHPDEFEHVASTLPFGQQHKELRNTQLESIWLYMAFSLYVHHWAYQPFGIEKGKEKLEAIKELDMLIAPFIGQTINNLNRTANGYYQYDPRRFHQKVLMVNGNLFAFLQNIRKHNPELSESFFKQFPLSFDEDKLGISKAKASLRPSSEPGFHEKTANKTLKAHLEHVPQVFEPLRKDLANHIDENTGLELDYPLSSKVTIETDGIHHVNKNKKHSIIHNIKAFLLREEGWSRVPMNADFDIAENAAFIARILHIPQVVEFSEHFQPLTLLAQTIRKEIIEAQKNMRPHSKDYILKLLSIEQNIRNFSQQRHFEVLLRGFQNKQDRPIILQAITAYDAYTNAVLKYQASSEKLERALKAIDEIEEKLTPYNENIAALNKQIAKDEAQLKDEVIPSIQKYTTILNPAEILKIQPDKVFEMKKYLKQRQEQKQALTQRIENSQRQILSIRAKMTPLELELRNEKLLLGFAKHENQDAEQSKGINLEKANKFFKMALPLEELDKVYSTANEQFDTLRAENAIIVEEQNRIAMKEMLAEQERKRELMEQLAKQDRERERKYERERKERERDRDRGRRRYDDRYDDRYGYGERDRGQRILTVKYDSNYPHSAKRNNPYSGTGYLEQVQAKETNGEKSRKHIKLEI